MQQLFLRGPSATIRALLLVTASIVLMTVDHRWQHLASVRGTLSYLVYPVQYLIDIPFRFYDWGDEVLSGHQFLIDENRRLREYQTRADVQLQKFNILAKENARLRRLLSATPKVGERVLVAEMLAVDIDPYKQQVIIDKSSSDGVYQGQAVIDAHGIMGQIIHVSKTSATAMLITDPNHAIPVQIDRNGIRSTAFGTGQSEALELRYIPHNADIQQGDLLISSGLGGRFPPDYPVAKVTLIERPSGESFARVFAEPAARLDRSREVLLVWNKEPQKTIKASPAADKQ